MMPQEAILSDSYTSDRGCFSRLAKIGTVLNLSSHKLRIFYLPPVQSTQRDYNFVQDKLWGSTS